MAKKTKTKKRTVRKKTMHKKKTVERKSVRVEKGPEYMIQVSDPKMMRKDLLEGLRSIIIFMQGYEKFKRIQEEKIIVFTRLKAQVKELNSLIEHKLKGYFPQGKLKPLGLEEETVEEPTKEEIPPEEIMEELLEEELPPEVEEKPEKKIMKSSPPKKRHKPISELDRLEMQLKDIERQLQKIE